MKRSGYPSPLKSKATYAGCVDVQAVEGAFTFVEIALSVAQVYAGGQVGIGAIEFIPAAGDDEIGVPVMVDVGHAGVDVFIGAVLVEVRLGGAGEFAGPVLEENRAFLSSGRADEYVLEAVLVEVADRRAPVLPWRACGGSGFRGRIR